MPRSPKLAPVAAPKAPRPQWVDHQPASYEISSYAYVSKDADDAGAEGTIECINLTEGEYMTCKRLVARLRGFDVPEPEVKNG